MGVLANDYARGVGGSLGPQSYFQLFGKISQSFKKYFKHIFKLKISIAPSIFKIQFYFFANTPIIIVE